MARLVLYALAALARAYDWTTPGQALTKFDCDAYPNPIQVFKADDSNPPYNVSELDLATGKYNKICDFPNNGGVNGFALMQYPDGGPQPGLKDNVYSFVCRGKKLERFDCASTSELDGTLIAQKEGTNSLHWSPHTLGNTRRVERVFSAARGRRLRFESSIAITTVSSSALRPLAGFS